jgi:tetratricopeptide (TPR) repeat protein
MLFLFHFKEDSSLGRLFVWKVSLLNIKEYIFNGVGFGGFEYQYNKWQAEYFMNHPDDIANAQLADYISFAYNEFLHVFIETGIIGLFIFIAVIYFVIRNTLIRIKKGNKITLLFIIPFSISFFSFVTISLISYPLQNIHLLIFFFTLIAILSYDMPSLIEINRFRMPITIAILFMTAAFSFSRFVYIKPYMKWKEADISYHNEDYSLSVQIYSNTIDYLGKDALFLQYYGKSLQMAGEHSKSVEILTESIKKRTDQQAYICLAIDNIGMQMYDSAETNLLYASSLIPNRLYPVYLLAKVFYSIDDLEKAKMYVNKGLNIPVKIPSSAISEMRTELNYLLQQCKEQSNQ